MGYFSRTRNVLTPSIAALAMSFVLPAWATDFAQAPILGERVSAGELPPVEERLPENPLVFETVESIGEYGGTLRRAILGGGDQHNIVRVIGHENLVREAVQLLPSDR